MREPPHWKRFTVSGSPTYPASCSTCLDCRTAHMWGHSPNCDSESLKPAILDSGTQSVDVPSATPWAVLHLGWGRGNEVRVLAADVQEPGALAVLGGQGSEPVPDVNQSGPVGDDGAVRTLIVGDALVPELLCVLCAVLEDGVHLHGGLVLDKVGGVLLDVVGGVLVLLDHLDKHVHVGRVSERGGIAIVHLLLVGAEDLLDGGVCVVCEGGGGVVTVRLRGSQCKAEVAEQR